MLGVYLVHPWSLLAKPVSGNFFTHWNWKEPKDFRINWYNFHPSSSVALVRVHLTCIWTQDPLGVTANHWSPWHILCAIIFLSEKRMHFITCSLWDPKDQQAHFPFFFFSLSVVTFIGLGDAGWEGHLVDIIANCTPAFKLLYFDLTAPLIHLGLSILSVSYLLLSFIYLPLSSVSLTFSLHTAMAY